MNIFIKWQHLTCKNRKKNQPKITMLSNPCVCFSSTDQNSSSRRNSRKNSTKINQAIPLYGLTGDTSIKSRSDGVVVVNEKYQRPKIPKITDFDKSKIYSWTSSKTPCPDYKYVKTNFYFLSVCTFTITINIYLLFVCSQWIYGRRVWNINR